MYERHDSFLPEECVCGSGAVEQRRGQESGGRQATFQTHEGCRVEPLIDGHAAMLSMCMAFLSAKRSILLTAWDIRADLPMVRGEDLLLDSEAARAERGLLARLQSAGLGEEALAFWAQGKLTVADVLGFAAARGVRVGVLLWDGYQAGMHLD